MSTKTKETLTVISQEEIGRDIFSLWLQTDQMAQNARPGQFLSLYTGDGSKLLPRPISICEIDKEDSKIRLVYSCDWEEYRNRRIFQTEIRRKD